MSPSTTSSGTTSSGHPASYKRRVRNYLLDSRFQLKYAGFLVGVAVGISAIVGTVLYTTTLAVFRESGKVVEESRQAAEESRKVSSVSRMNIRDLASDSPELLAEFDRESSAYDKAIAEHDRAVVAQEQSLIRGQRWMLGSLVGGLLLTVVLIGLFGIYFTHKVAGPIHKMTGLLRQVGKGNLRVDARLRRGDELKAFFETFTRMVSDLREVELERLQHIEGALAALERSDTKAAQRSLESARRAIRDAIGE